MSKTDDGLFEYEEIEPGKYRVKPSSTWVDMPLLRRLGESSEEKFYFSSQEVEAGEAAILIDDELIRIRRDGVERQSPNGYNLTPWEEVRALAQIVAIGEKREHNS